MRIDCLNAYTKVGKDYGTRQLYCVKICKRILNLILKNPNGAKKLRAAVSGRLTARRVIFT